MISWLDIPFRITRPDVDEAAVADGYEQMAGASSTISPRVLASHLALLKARSVRSVTPGEWILAADTVVELNGQVLGKPEDGADAYEMLSQLRGRVHYVHTGVTLRRGNFSPRYYKSSGLGDQVVGCWVTTRVCMREYADEEIEAYVSSGDPMDKAGAYAIQHTGFHPVARLTHCYTNVVGLPLCGVMNLLRTQGVVINVDVSSLCYDHFGYRCYSIDRGTML
jgi:MAF protein